MLVKHLFVGLDAEEQLPSETQDGDAESSAAAGMRNHLQYLWPGVQLPPGPCAHTAAGHRSVTRLYKLSF